MLLSVPVGAQTASVSERIRIQGAYAHQDRQTPSDDVAAQAVPELSFLLVGKRTQLRVTYTLLASVHTALPVDFSNRLLLSSSFELTKRTTLLVSAEGGQSSVGNALVTRGADQAAVGTLPSSRTQLVNAHVSEALAWEASPVVRLGEAADASYVTTLDAPTASASTFANVVLSADRSWVRDAIGVDLRAAYGRTEADGTPTLTSIPFSVTPHYRRDLDASLSVYAAAGPVVIYSPDPGSPTLVRPYVSAIGDYLVGDDTTVELDGSIGTQPSALTSQLLYAENANLRLTVPISRHHRVRGAATLGYMHGSVLARRDGVVQPPAFDTVVADAGATWDATPLVGIFARYQLYDQLASTANGVATPSLLRSVVFVGIQLSSPTDGVRVPARFSRRVDGNDPTR